MFTNVSKETGGVSPVTDFHAGSNMPLLSLKPCLLKSSLSLCQTLLKRFTPHTAHFPTAASYVKIASPDNIVGVHFHSSLSACSAVVWAAVLKDEAWGRLECASVSLNG